MSFGQWIKQQREARGMQTQPMLADAMDALERLHEGAPIALRKRG